MEQRLTRNSLALLCALATLIPINNLQGQCAWTPAERDPLLTMDVFAGDPGDVSCTSDNSKAIISSASKGLAEYDFASNQLKSMGNLNASVRKTVDLGSQIAAVGAFSSIEDSEGVKNIRGVALFDKATRTWSGLGQGIVDGEAKAIASIGTRLLVGGSFTAVKQADGTDLAVNGLLNTILQPVFGRSGAMDW